MDATDWARAALSSISRSRAKVASEVGIMIALGLPLAVTSTRPARLTADKARPGLAENSREASHFVFKHQVSCKCSACQAVWDVLILLKWHFLMRVKNVVFCGEDNCSHRLETKSPRKIMKSRGILILLLEDICPGLDSIDGLLQRR